MRKEKGITLIALVITIIIMLILIAVTIRLAIDGGLFNYAKTAKEGTASEALKDQELSNLASNLTYDDLIDNYSEKKSITFTLKGVQYQAKEGMTWAEWINNPKYNSIGVFISNAGYVQDSDGTDIVYANKNRVLATEDIVENYNYTISNTR